MLPPEARGVRRSENRALSSRAAQQVQDGPATLAGVVVAAVAGTTVGYAALSKDVTLTLDGRTTEVSAIGDTVGDVLAAEGIELTDKDLVAPAIDEAVTDGTAIAVQFGRPLELVRRRRRRDLLGQLDRRRQRARRDRPPLRRCRPLREPQRLDRSQRPQARRRHPQGRSASRSARKDLRKRKVAAVTVADVLDSMGVEVGRHDKVSPVARHRDRRRRPGRRQRHPHRHQEGRARGRRRARHRARGPRACTRARRRSCSAGRDGVRNVTYRLRFVNGELVARKVVDGRRAGQGRRRRS